jgi:hypothetical protein
MEDYKDLGYANSGLMPDYYWYCKDLGHQLKEARIKGGFGYSCPICKYKYKIDTSD